MHTYSPDETYFSLVRTFPDLTQWSLPTLLAQYGELAIRQRDAETCAEMRQFDVESLGGRTAAADARDGGD